MLFYNDKFSPFVVVNGKRYMFADKYFGDSTILEVSIPSANYEVEIHELHMRNARQLIGINWGDGSKDYFDDYLSYQWNAEMRTTVTCGTGGSTYYRPLILKFKIVDITEDILYFLENNKEFEIESIEYDTVNDYEFWKIKNFDVTLTIHSDTDSTDQTDSYRDVQWQNTTVSVHKSKDDASHVYNQPGKYLITITDSCDSINIVNNISGDNIGNALTRVVKFGGKINTLENRCFMGAKKLSSIYIPSQISSIEREAFKESDSLKEVVFEDSTSLVPHFNGYLENMTFAGHTFLCCYNLTTIKSLNNTVISTDAVGEDIEYIVFPGDIGSYEISTMKPNGSIIDMPNPYTAHGDFGYCEKLSSNICFRDSTYINALNGNGTTNRVMFYGNKNITHVLFPKVKQFARASTAAFQGCNNLKYLYVPKLTKMNCTYTFRWLPQNAQLSLDFRDKNDDIIPSLDSTFFRSSSTVQLTAFKCIVPKELFGEWCVSENWIQYNGEFSCAADSSFTLTDIKKELFDDYAFEDTDIILESSLDDDTGDYYWSLNGQPFDSYYGTINTTVQPGAGITLTITYKLGNIVSA